MNTIRCTPAHAGAILAIFNHEILHSTGLYDYRPRTPDMMAAWFEAKAKGNFPVLGLEAEDGTLMGFASYGTFRAWPAYKYSVEHSVYLDRPYRGRGLGKVLMQELIAVATAQEYHMMVGGIDAANTASVALHRRLGFSHCASIKQAAYKFGRWLDLEFYQLLLPGPRTPVEA